jgi:hypothetical protein
MAKPNATQLAQINQLARVPLNEDEVYTFEAKLVGDNIIPRRFFQISPNFLRKMADQAKAGVSLLLDHSWANLGVMTIPLGRTYNSRLQQDGNELALYADHYMKLGQEINGIKIDQLADGIDSGTIFDTSIGFISTKHLCSICRENYYSGACSHFRGNEYEGKMCIVEMDDGQLMENSLVFDGAYPGAGVVNLSQEQSDTQHPTNWDVLSEDAKSLPGDGRVFYSFSSKSGFTGYVPKQQQIEKTLTPVEGDESMSAEALKQAELALDQAKAAGNVLNGLLTQIRTALGVTADGEILSKLTSLSAQAADGVQYKTKVTEQACGAGVRAMGDAFNVEAMKLSLSNLPVVEIEKIALSYEAQAVKVLGGGGQHTATGDVNLPDNALSGAGAGNPNADGTKQTPEQLQAQAKVDARAALDRTGNASIMKEAK